MAYFEQLWIILLKFWSFTKLLTFFLVSFSRENQSQRTEEKHETHNPNLSDAIKPYAFLKSDYPLILSIENHCSFKQQDVMAEYLKSILGDLLYIDSPDDKK